MAEKNDDELAEAMSHTKLICTRCHYVWTYTGELATCTCPSCRKWVKIPERMNEIVREYEKIKRKKDGKPKRGT